MTAPTWRDLPPEEKCAFVEAVAAEAARPYANPRAANEMHDALLAALARLDPPAPQCVKAWYWVGGPTPGARGIEMRPDYACRAGRAITPGTFVPSATMARVRHVLAVAANGPYPNGEAAALLRELEAE